MATAPASIWRIILVYKLFIFIAIFSGTYLYNVELPLETKFPQSPFSRQLANWDSSFYLDLSQNGYKRDSSSCAFYPAWPLLISGIAWLKFNSPLVGSLLLANGFSVIGFLLFFRIVKQKCGGPIAAEALILLVAFPGALFFSFPYTESLYFLMIMMFIRGLQLGCYWGPCVIALLSPLTKAVGIFLILPFAWHFLEEKKSFRHWLLLLFPVFGYGLYFAFMYAFTGNALEGFEAQEHFPNSPSIRNMINFPGFWNALINVGSFDGMEDAIIDRSFFIMAVVLLPMVYCLNRVWFFYTLPMVLVPALTSWFMSYRRYVMVCFPIFIVLATLLHKIKSRFIFWYYIVLLSALQFYAVIKMVNAYWAG